MAAYPLHIARHGALGPVHVRLAKRLAISAFALLLGVLALGWMPAAADPPNQPMTFEWVADSSGEGQILAGGVITPETPEAFVRFVADRAGPAAPLVVLNSDGGDLEGGLALGRAIRDGGYSTDIGEMDRSGERAAGRCVSACALAFLGGSQRTVSEGSYLGVHQLSMSCVQRASVFASYPWLPLPNSTFCPEFDEGVTAVQAAQGQVAAYISEMGIDAELLPVMAAVPAAEVHVLEPAMLEALNIVTKRQE